MAWATCGMLRATLRLAALAAASAVLIDEELDLQTFEAAITRPGITSAFVWFQKKDCRHCRIMADQWQYLGEEFDESPNVLIAAVDCGDDSGSVLCSKYNVLHYPACLWFYPPRVEGLFIEYHGDKVFKKMKKFVEKYSCVPGEEKCSAADKKALDAYMAMDVEPLNNLYLETGENFHEASRAEANAQNAFQKLKKVLDPEDKRLTEAAQRLADARRAPVAVFKEHAEKYMRMIAVLVARFDRGFDQLPPVAPPPIPPVAPPKEEV